MTPKVSDALLYTISKNIGNKIEKGKQYKD
jgi:hypothetical protein